MAKPGAGLDNLSTQADAWYANHVRKPSAAKVRKATAVVASNAESVEDCRELLDMLGLSAEGTWKQ